LRHSEICVRDITVLLGITKSAVSRQLRRLRQTRLARNRKNGKVVYYSLDDEHVSNVFAQGLLHVRE
jgi:DNA-binding transcriptional ArsR family regulator